MCVVTTDSVLKAVERGSGGITVIHLVLLVVKNGIVIGTGPV